jgi:serpin B
MIMKVSGSSQHVFVLFVLALLLLTGVGSVEGSSKNFKAVAEDNKRFAVDLYGQLSKSDGNLFFSPFSISTALVMTYAGAKGETAKQIQQTLHLSSTGDAPHEGFGGLIQSLNERGETGGFQLSVANALWAQSGYKLLPEFLDLVEGHYGAGLMQADFRRDPEAARKEINTWVEEKTMDRIKDLLQPGTISTLTRLVITNAIYFKGRWREEFDEGRTRDAHFILLNGDEIKTPMMRQTHDFGYFETDDLQVLSMPYVDDELSMVILLPRENDGIGVLEKELSTNRLAEWMEKLQRAEVVVYIPRFKMTSSFGLSRTLRDLGIVDAFDKSSADFSGMTGKKDLYISDVVHKAFVEVNEEGTEAAAATAVAIETTGGPEGIFNANHPFVFLIKDNKSGSILFMGRVMNPLE